MICQTQKIVIMYSSVSARSLSSIAQICISTLNFPIKLSEPSRPTIAIFPCMYFIVEIFGIVSSVLPVITVLDVSDSETRIIAFSINNILPIPIFLRWKKSFSICKKQGSGGSIYYPLTEEIAIQEWYIWHEKEGSDYQWEWYTRIDIKQYDERIVGYEQAAKNIQACLSGILQCSVTSKPFKIISQELVYYIEHHIPLPDVCPDARHLERSKLRNAHQLYERQCAKTGEKLISTYALDRPEIIYWEKAFQDLMV